MSTTTQSKPDLAAIRDRHSRLGLLCYSTYSPLTGHTCCPVLTYDKTRGGDLRRFRVGGYYVGELLNYAPTAAVSVMLSDLERLSQWDQNSPYLYGLADDDDLYRISGIVADELGYPDWEVHRPETGPITITTGDTTLVEIDQDCPEVLDWAVHLIDDARALLAERAAWKKTIRRVAAAA